MIDNILISTEKLNDFQKLELTEKIIDNVINSFEFNNMINSLQFNLNTANSKDNLNRLITIDIMLKKIINEVNNEKIN